MSRRWAIILITTVVTIAIWSGWEVYKAFTKEKDVGEYETYVQPISPELNTDLVVKIYKMQDQVLVKDKDIQPQN